MFIMQYLCDVHINGPSVFDRGEMCVKPHINGFYSAVINHDIPSCTQRNRMFFETVGLVFSSVEYLSHLILFLYFRKTTYCSLRQFRNVQ